MKILLQDNVLCIEELGNNAIHSKYPLRKRWEERSPVRWRKELRFENDWKPAERPLSILNAKLPNFIPRCLDSISSSGKSLEQVKMGVNRGDRCSHASGCKTSMSRWTMHPEHVIFKGNCCVHRPLISGYGPQCRTWATYVCIHLVRAFPRFRFFHEILLLWN